MPRVLLIEDNDDTGESLSAMLELAGHPIACWARNGREALSFLAGGGQADLALTDILMPEMDGLESIQAMRKTHPTLRLVAMTGQRDVPYLRIASLFGAQTTLQKPFGVQELKDAIETAMAASL